jgi:cholest-4-en-3-one 26-monooxygenase
MHDFDVYTPDIYLKGVPHETFTELRANAPVYFHKEPNGRGYWAVTKHSDIMAISRDPATYSSHRGATFIEDQTEDDLSVMQMVMLNMDPPQHLRFRGMVKHAFVPKMVMGLEQKIRRVVRQIVDKIATTGRCDFVQDVAMELPLQVIAEMLGVPIEDRFMVYQWSNQMLDSQQVAGVNNERDSAAGMAAAMEMWQYAGALGQQRFENPTDDLISMLMKPVSDGGLKAEEFASFFMILFVAGNETTRNAISGGMLALMENPEQRERLLADSSLLPLAVEEIVRWVSPINYFRRTATRDVELRGCKIRENDKVVLYYPSANRDEEVFTDPFQFDVGRQPNDHLAFGTGQHFCLGANLARLEIRVMFEELLKRLPDISLDGPVGRVRSNFVNGFKSMPVRFHPERARALP